MINPDTMAFVTVWGWILAVYFWRKSQDAQNRLSGLSTLTKNQIDIAEAAFNILGNDADLPRAVDYWMKHEKASK